MKPKPASSIFHIFFKSITLRLVVREIIDHHQQLVVLDFFIIQIFHITGGIKYKTITDSKFFEKLYGIISKINMSFFNCFAIKSQYFKSWILPVQCTS